MQGQYLPFIALVVDVSCVASAYWTPFLKMAANTYTSLTSGGPIAEKFARDIV